MIKNRSVFAAAALALTGSLALLPTHSAQAAPAEVKCHLKFSLSGWAIIYKHATGVGVVTCDNGQHAKVKISANGGGLTAGKYRINDGKGDITHVKSINDVFGTYAQAGADAGVVKSADAQVLTKGTTSLALSGTGQGFNIGVSLGAFSIERYNGKK